MAGDFRLRAYSLMCLRLDAHYTRRRDSWIKVRPSASAHLPSPSSIEVPPRPIARSRPSEAGLRLLQRLGRLSGVRGNGLRPIVPVAPLAKPARQPPLAACVVAPFPPGERVPLSHRLHLQRSAAMQSGGYALAGAVPRHTPREPLARQGWRTVAWLFRRSTPAFVESVG